MKTVGTCAWWICVRVKSTMYSLLVTVVSVAVRIVSIFFRKKFGG
jgi:hypothetical protein